MPYTDSTVIPYDIAGHQRVTKPFPDRKECRRSTVVRKNPLPRDASFPWSCGRSHLALRLTCRLPGRLHSAVDRLHLACLLERDDLLNLLQRFIAHFDAPLVLLLQGLGRGFLGTNFVWENVGGNLVLGAGVQMGGNLVLGAGVQMGRNLVLGAGTTSSTSYKGFRRLAARICVYCRKDAERVKKEVQKATDLRRTNFS